MSAMRHGILSNFGRCSPGNLAGFQGVGILAQSLSVGDLNSIFADVWSVSESSLKTLLARRLAAVEGRLGAACSRAGRCRDEVTLVAITKTVSPAVAALLPELEIHHLGENRPQELWRKAAALPTGVVWHLVGHLQRNKIERTLPLVQLIHSVDSIRLLNALEEGAAKRQRPIDVLLEINASREARKSGFAPEDFPALLPCLRELRYIHVQGLMTMAAFEAEPEHCRGTFIALRQLRDQLRDRVEPPHHLHNLSMGMTNDFEVAIEEGATYVRIGTALFEGIGGPEP
jgi:pyridoxal phosphate enzyme (YggS family)